MFVNALLSLGGGGKGVKENRQVQMKILGKWHAFVLCKPAYTKYESSTLVSFHFFLFIRLNNKIIMYFTVNAQHYKVTFPPTFQQF